MTSGRQEVLTDWDDFEEKNRMVAEIELWMKKKLDFGLFNSYI